MTVVVHRVTKQAARYTPAGGVEKCALCRFFAPQGWCGKVVGPVSARGWCKYYSREAVQRWSNPGYAGSGGGLPAGATLNLNFMTGALDPLLTFTRASTGTYFDSGGVMRTAAINAPRWDYDPVSLQLRGLLLEDQRTNGIRNSTVQGAVPGTPGTMPTNWSWGFGVTTLSQQIVGMGTEGGIAYADFRVFGTVAGNATIVLVPEANNVIAGTNGQAFTTSLYWRLVGGSFNGVTLIQSVIRELTSGGALVKDNLLAFATPAAGSLASQRTQASIALNGGGTTAFAQPRYNFTVSNGAAIDFTLRIGGTQLEQGDFATSFIPTTAAAVTRSIDSCLIPPANMSPWFAPPGGSWFAEFDYLDSTPVNSRIISRVGAGGVSSLFLNTSNGVAQYDAVGLATANAVSANTVSKACSTWAVGEAKICANGGAIAKSATLVTGYGAFATTGVPFLTPAGPVNSDNTSGHLRHVQYYPRVLADAEMQSLTTITDPSLFLNFMNPNTLDPRIAFTRASTATYTDVNGVLQTVNNDTPRWDYDPVTLALRGLLLEEARTNLIFPSGDVGDPLWLKSGVVVTAPVVTSNQTTAPDGTTTAARVVYPAVTGAGALSFFNKSTVVTAAVYTFSVWLRGNAGGEQLYLSAVAGSTWYSSPRITLTTQWRRYVLTTSTLSALGWAFCVGTDLRDTVGQTSTTGGTVFAWGMQLELGGFPTSFILTTGSTVTRAADSCVIPSANMTPWYSATAGSWQAEFDFIDATSAAPAGRIITQGALANTAALHMPGAPAFTVGQFDGAAAMNAVTTVSANTVTRAATTWAVGQAKVCTRGGPVASSASLTTGYGGYATNGVRFMTAVNPALSNYGHIRVIQYWPRVLPDAEMQQVTT